MHCSTMGTKQSFAPERLIAVCGIYSSVAGLSEEHSPDPVPRLSMAMCRQSPGLGSRNRIVSRIFRTFIMRRLRFQIGAVDRVVVACSWSTWLTTSFRRCAVVARPTG
jgi:hypothetical protein